MSYKTIWEDTGIYWQLSGIVTAQEIFDITNEFFNDPKSDNVKYQIVDCQNVERFELEDTTMQEIAALDYAASLSIHNVKVALVGNKTQIKSINQEYIEQSRNFHSSWKVMNFDDMASARNWISSL